MMRYLLRKIFCKCEKGNPLSPDINKISDIEGIEEKGINDEDQELVMSNM